MTLKVRRLAKNKRVLPVERYSVSGSELQNTRGIKSHSVLTTQVLGTGML